MYDFSFESMGTGWQVSVDVDAVPPSIIDEIHQKSEAFNQKYSRFIDGSEANAFREAPKGTYHISPMLAEILQACKKLELLTDGKFNASIATLFESIGYDAQYNFQKAPEKVSWQPPTWSIEKDEITISGPIVFDIGGIGKGYWIDQISQILKKHHLNDHLVEGGGDMFATQKKDGTPWRVALEWPGKPDTALGIVELKNQGLAVSDVFKRKWKNWHHLMDAKTNTPVDQIIGCAAIAPSAFLADQMTSIISFAPPEKYDTFAQEINAQYLYMTKEEKVFVSEGWEGEMF
jgi:thiamine biosynthesis lipoprotein